MSIRTRMSLTGRLLLGDARDDSSTTLDETIKSVILGPYNDAWIAVSKYMFRFY